MNYFNPTSIITVPAGVKKVYVSTNLRVNANSYATCYYLVNGGDQLRADGSRSSVNTGDGYEYTDRFYIQNLSTGKSSCIYSKTHGVGSVNKTNVLFYFYWSNAINNYTGSVISLI